MADFGSRAARIVLRLSDEEREVLKLVVAALKVSEYTDDVDGMTTYKREETITKAMKEIFMTVVGLAHVSGGLPKPMLTKIGRGEASYVDLEPIVGRAFEITRRYKRFNPDKIRSEYGKLVMMLQDYAAFGLHGHFKFEKLLLPVKTVGSTLRKIDASELLNDPLLQIATTPLPPRASSDAVAEKASARAALVAKYGGSDAANQELIDRCLKSIDDSVTFVQVNTRPIKVLLNWLDEFNADSEATGSLAIRTGKDGACLTHSHSDQVGYVREALSLWCEVQENIFDFWETVESDMLVTGPNYRWRNTGQGFHRVSSGPATYDRMMKAISVTHNRLGGWVGSKVVHLGDNDVPNPLVFIDKYTIIPNLVTPIVAAIEALGDAFHGSEEPYPGYRKLLLLGKAKTADDLKYGILRDFFRHGFDGSGDDGGSCIDGRLTSAWNWCSLLHKKSFYSVFLLTGFNGFDSNYN